MVTRLLQGHDKFRTTYFERERELFEELARGHHEPLAMVISCSDARVVPNLILDSEPGDLFVVRNIANLIPPFGADFPNRSVGAAIEYAIGVLKIPHLIVCGHTGCGGLRALAQGHKKLADEMPTLEAWLHDAIELRQRMKELLHDDPRADLEKLLPFENVAVQLENLLTYPVVQRELDADRLELHGWVYDLEGAVLRVYEPLTNQFAPIESLMPK
jgi:carbonic anhydrase